MRNPMRVLTTVVLCCSVSSAAAAQSILKKLKEKVTQKVDQGSQTLIDSAASRAVRTVRCLIGDAACIRKAREAGQGVVVTNAQGQAVSSSDSAAAIAAAGVASPSPKPGEGAWANYDFIPGDRVLFAEDFTHDKIGDFPRRLEFKSGNFEIVEWQGGRYLQSLANGSFYIPLPEVLPERFTVEIEYSGPGGQSATLSFAEGEADAVVLSSGESGIDGRKVQAHASSGEDLRDKLFNFRVMVDGHYAKVYMNSKRVANVPNAELGRSNRIYLTVPPSGTKLIGSIRVAAGGSELYDALAERGRVATQGVLFASGSDELRPESTPTLKAISELLQEHPELRLTIEGHTDNVGDPAANQALSERRAEAVKRYLVGAGIAESRLRSAGFGATKPVAPNTTPEGRQNNRRVELVKN